MPIDDLWMSKKIDPQTGKRKRNKRYGKGRRWRVRWTDPETGRTAPTKSFDRKEDAIEYETSILGSIQQGDYVDPKAGAISVTAWATKWRESMLHDPATQRLVEQAMRLHVLPILGDLKMRSVRPTHIRGWVKDRVDNEALAPSTLRVVYSYIASMFKAASNDRIIGKTPCVGIGLPDLDGDGKRWLPTPDQVHQLYLAMYPRYRAAVIVAAACGLRVSEVLGLERHAIDFDHGVIRVTQQLKQVTGGCYIGKTKTKHSVRTVEMPALAVEALRIHLAEFPSDAIELRDTTGKKAVRRMADLVFTTRTGKPVSRGTYARPWCTARARVDGVPDDFGMHGLRHYYATLLIHGGASVKTVQLKLGHSNPMITLNTYTHEWPDAIDTTRSLVDAALGTRVPVAARTLALAA